MQLELTAEERQLLIESLRLQLSDLSYEIGNTDSFDYRRELKQRAAVFKKILAALEAG